MRACGHGGEAGALLAAPPPFHTVASAALFRGRLPAPPRPLTLHGSGPVARACGAAQNKWREEYRRLEASLERLARERSQLREEAETANMDPAEARRTLLAKAKEHNAQLGEVKKALRQEQDQRASVEEKLRDIETQLQQRRSSSADGSKVRGRGA